MNIVQCNAIVKGKVQGIGFRQTTKSLADQFALTGFVRNLPDGSVEICAQGARFILDEFIERLQGEFPYGYIKEITADFENAVSSYQSFAIHH